MKGGYLVPLLYHVGQHAPFAHLPLEENLLPLSSDTSATNSFLKLVTVANQTATVLQFPLLRLLLFLVQLLLCAGSFFTSSPECQKQWQQVKTKEITGQT